VPNVLVEVGEAKRLESVCHGRPLGECREKDSPRAPGHDIVVDTRHVLGNSRCMNEKTDDAPPAFEDATEATAEAHSPGRDTLVATLARISAETARLEAAHTRAKDEIRQFEERLQRGVKEGAFFALLVNPKHYPDAISELQDRFPVEVVDFEGLFIDALKEAADKAKVDWDLVVQTDATPGKGDWDRLMLLVRRAIPQVEKRLLAAEKTILLVYPGLIARYGQMDLIERLRDKVGRRDGIPGLWMLIPGDSQALIEGQALPILAPGQRTRIPTAWLQNVHRSKAAHV